MRSAPIIALAGLAFLGAFAACGNDVSSTEDAKNAYLGLDPSVDRAIQLGFDGYNLALRLRHAGYTNVYWYRGGREAWMAAGKTTAPVTPRHW